MVALRTSCPPKRPRTPGIESHSKETPKEGFGNSGKVAQKYPRKYVSCVTFHRKPTSGVTFELLPRNPQNLLSGFRGDFREGDATKHFSVKKGVFSEKGGREFGESGVRISIGEAIQ